MESTFNIEIAIRVIFEYPDLKDLAAYIDVIKQSHGDETQHDEVSETEEMESFTL